MAWKCPECGNRVKFKQERVHYGSTDCEEDYTDILDDNGDCVDTEYGDTRYGDTNWNNSDELTDVECYECGARAVKCDEEIAPVPNKLDTLMKIKEKVMKNG